MVMDFRLSGLSMLKAILLIHAELGDERVPRHLA
jgi:hypothetical protein